MEFKSLIYGPTQLNADRATSIWVYGGLIICCAGIWVVGSVYVNCRCPYGTVKAEVFTAISALIALRLISCAVIGNAYRVAVPPLLFQLASAWILPQVAEQVGAH